MLTYIWVYNKHVAYSHKVVLTFSGPSIHNSLAASPEMFFSFLLLSNAGYFRMKTLWKFLLYSPPTVLAVKYMSSCCQFQLFFFLTLQNSRLCPQLLRLYPTLLFYCHILIPRPVLLPRTCRHSLWQYSHHGHWFTVCNSPSKFWDFIPWLPLPTILSSSNLIHPLWYAEHEISHIGSCVKHFIWFMATDTFMRKFWKIHMVALSTGTRTM